MGWAVGRRLWEEGRAELQRYWGAPLDRYQRHLEQRLLVWLGYTLLAGGLTFAALQLKYGHRPVLQFRGMYAWHTALNFGGCFIVAELLCDGLCRWFRQPLNVARMWLAGLAAFLIGFVLQRTLVYDAIAAYYPDLLLMYQRFPIMRPTAARMFIYCLPFWLATFALAVWLMLRLQRRLTPTIISVPVTVPAADTPDSLLMNTDRGVVRLRPAAITHVSMDDHYANIHLQEEDGRRKVFVRMTLQQVREQLPKDCFIQVHRSHLINLRHLVELRKVGRSWESLVGRERQPLPVSRQRVRELREYLQTR